MTRSTADARPIATAAGAARGAPARGAAVLASKLAPPEPAHATVERPRLLALLSRAVQRSALTLLSGPAGSGKTVLADSWRQTQAGARGIGWLTLDQYDDEPAAFWNYALEALAGAGVDLSQRPALVPGEPPPEWLITALAADLAATPHTVVLIVDNADHLADRSIVAGLDHLVRNGGRRFHLVLCGRADPPLPLHRYRLAGTLAEIRGDDLGFTPEETRELLAAMGVPVSEEVARGLCAETQGWAVGLRLAAAPLKQGVPPEQLVTSLARDDGPVAQYLFAEVLDEKPASIRRILLRISVTPELWPDLVDRLCGRPDVRRVLAGLAHANAFVEEVPGAPGGFRIHPLFREMLKAQLAYDHPGELAGLQRTCAAWYAEAGRPLDAVGYAVDAEDWTFVTRLLVDDLLVVRLLAHGTDPALRGLGALPPGLRGPEAAVIRTVVALATGRPPAPDDLAATARAREDGDRLALRLSAALACLTADAETELLPSEVLRRVDEAAALVEQLPEEERLRTEPAVVLGDLRAFALLRTDAPGRQLVAGLTAAASTAQAAGARRLRSHAVGSLALVEALDGHLTRAVQLATEAEGFAAEQGIEETRRDPAPATALAWVHLRRYALIEAREWLARARARDRSAASRTVGAAPLHAVLECQQLRLRHEYDAAEEVLRPYLQGPRLPRWISEQVVGETVRLAMARGHVDEGLTMLRDRSGDERWSRRLRATAGLVTGDTSADLPDDDDPSTSLAEAVDAAVVRACQLLEAGRVPAAAEQLAAALDLARPELLRWPFVDTPPQARKLLRSHPGLHAPGAWLNPSSGAQPRAAGHGPRAAGAAPAADPEPRVVEPLSERETEVLRYLAEMLSTAEIAATMFISVNTVRTHIRSILRKLAVSRRYQAVRRARERGLL